MQTGVMQQSVLALVKCRQRQCAKLLGSEVQTPSKVTRTQTTSIALYNAQLISKVLIWPVCCKGSHSFTCHPHMNHTCLYSPATRHHRPLAGTNLHCLVNRDNRCEKLAQGYYAACPAETWTHDLLIASPTLYHSATTPPQCCLHDRYVRVPK